MIDAMHFLPDESGPCANPVLFGVAQALAEIFPVEVAASPAALSVPNESMVPPFTEGPANDLRDGGETLIAA